MGPRKRLEKARNGECAAASGRPSPPEPVALARVSDSTLQNVGGHTWAVAATCVRGAPSQVQGGELLFQRDATRRGCDSKDQPSR